MGNNVTTAQNDLFLLTINHPFSWTGGQVIRPMAALGDAGNCLQILGTKFPGPLTLDPKEPTPGEKGASRRGIGTGFGKLPTLFSAFRHSGGRSQPL